jgi:hypothetical protein
VRVVLGVVARHGTARQTLAELCVPEIQILVGEGELEAELKPGRGPGRVTSMSPSRLLLSTFEL